MTGGSSDPTIYEWGGGRPAFARWLDVFYDLVEGDDLLAPVFDGHVTREHRDHVTTWWCEVMGGPAAYTSDHGGYEHMLAKHRGLEITAEQRLRFVTLLSRAADAAELPADPEFRAAIMAARLSLDLVPRRPARGEATHPQRAGQPRPPPARRAQPRHAARAPQRRGRPGVDGAGGRSRDAALGRRAGAPAARCRRGCVLAALLRRLTWRSRPGTGGTTRQMIDVARGAEPTI